MALSENQPSDEPTRTRGSGGDVQSKGIPDPNDPDRSEEAEGAMEGERAGGATPNEE
jgi:hypothetical protein